MTASRDGSLIVREVASEKTLVQLETGGVPVLRGEFSGGGGPLRVLAAAEDGERACGPSTRCPARSRGDRASCYEWEVAREARLALPAALPLRAAQ
ncbi:MAG: hypothetical protein H6828_00485 [Planctomycetes bacterium]|nr:hypothetical protein [Planctomycetota bacterium]